MKWNRIIWFLLIVLCAFVLGYFRGRVWDGTEYEELIPKCLPIFHELEDEDFDIAKILNNEIVLYVHDRESYELLKIKSIPYRSDLSKEILYIENYDTQMAFWHGGWLDDVEGLMFMKSDYDVSSSFNGLARIKVLNVNEYIVYTAQ